VAVQNVSLRTVKRRQFVAETRSYADSSDIQASMTFVGLIHGGGLIVRIRLLNILLLSALVLAVSRLWLFLSEPPPALPAISAGGAPPAPETAEGEQNPEVPAPPPEAYDVIVARDLFSPARGVVPPAPAAAARPETKPQPPRSSRSPAW